MKSSPSRPHHVGQLAVVATAIAVLAASCSTSSAQGSTLGDQTLTNLSPVEAEALDDKVVSFTELEQAGEVFSDCLELVGFSTSFEGPNFGPSSVAAEFAADATSQEEAQAESDRQDASYDACRSETQAITDVWVLQNRASRRELDRAIENLPGCLSNAGVDVDEAASLEEAVDAAASFRSDAGTSDAAVTEAETCLAAAAAVTGFPLPGLADALAELDVAAG